LAHAQLARPTDPALAPAGARDHASAELAGLVLLLAAGLALRLWGLDLVPPGLSHDEAYDALNAVEIARGARPLFFESNNGREPLFMYLVALAFSAWGVGPAQLRLVPALAGTGAIWLIWLLARRALGARVAWSGAALMAVAFWPLFDSRVGLRAALLPLLVAGLAYGLWRWHEAEADGARASAAGWAALAGLALGAGLDSYTVARFSPALPLGFAAYLAATHRLAPARAALGLALVLGVAALCFAPLIAYFLAHPSAFWGRSGQVNDLRFLVERGDLQPLLEDTWNTLGMFTFRGDPFMRYNLAGRPLFDPLVGALFYLGLVAAARRLRASAGAALALLGLVVGLLPSATTGESPHFLRAIGAQPFVFLFPALGLVALADWLARWRIRGAGPFAALAVLAAVLTAALTLRDYFVVWPSQPRAREIYGAPMAALARELDAGTGPSFVSAEYPADLDRFTLDVSRGLRRSDLTWFDGRLALPLRRGQPATYLIASNARPPGEVLGALLAAGAHGAGDLDVVRLADPPALTPTHPLPARVGESLELLGYDLPDRAVPGGTARVILYWRVLDRPAAELSFFVHLIGNLGSLWAQLDGLGYPIDGWRAGDLLVQWHDLAVPAGAPPVDYAIEAGAYRRADGSRLPVTVDGRSDDRLRLGRLAVERPERPTDLPPSAQPVGVRFGEAIRLAGFEVDRAEAARGRALSLTLYWQALGRTSAEYTVFAHLVGDAPQPVAQGDGPPAYGMYPTRGWTDGDLIRDRHEIELPADLPARRYWILVGLYRPDDGARLAPAGQPAGPLARLTAWLERRTPYRAGPRVDGDHLVLTAIDLRAG
jgi:4-amino-4-deoxy-L-arabinose transferase-like glycosyltransferase